MTKRQISVNKFKLKHPNYNKDYLIKWNLAKKLGKKFSIKTVWLTHDPNYLKNWRKKNREKLNARVKLWQKNNPEKFKKSKNKYLSNHPWVITFNNIKQRCSNQKDAKYKYYGGKGIKFFLSLKDIEFIWKRDTAYKLKHASIDRIDSNGHYTIKNCRFIEMSENRKRR